MLWMPTWPHDSKVSIPAVCCFSIDSEIYSFVGHCFVNRFGVTYQGKVGDDIEVKVDDVVER